VATSVVVSMFVARCCTELVYCFGCGSGMGILWWLIVEIKRTYVRQAKHMNWKGERSQGGVCVHGQLF